MHGQTYSRQYLRNVVSSLVHEGHDPIIKYAELKYVQRAFDATGLPAPAGWRSIARWRHWKRGPQRAPQQF
jgi:hypothetical protein